MANLKIKSGVKPVILILAAAVINTANQMGLTQDIYITAGTDGVHMVGSKHYTLEAIDVRSKNIAKKHEFLAKIKSRLGKNYDCILESEGKSNEHFHIEYDPKS